MDLAFSADDEIFRGQVRAWLEAHLQGEHAWLRGRGGPGDEHVDLDARRKWERVLAHDHWNCIGWPTEYGGRGASLRQQVIFSEEYALARAPGRLGHIGETLVGPTLIAFGTEAQKQRFLGPIQEARELWCQGYSEPNAGSDLANVQTRGVRVGDGWEITGQKTWTSMAAWADWCFVLCRTNLDVPKHKGLSYLLVPMKQPGITIRPIKQLTGTSEFCEVFFDGARTDSECVVGPVDGGWQIAMATLAFERGVSTLGQQTAFKNELATVVEVAKENGALGDPLLRQRLVRAWMGLEIMRLNALRTLSAEHDGQLGREAMMSKLYWANWHRDLGDLAMDVLGPDGDILSGANETNWANEAGETSTASDAGAVGAGSAELPLSPLQRLYLISRADTIYAGSNEIQRNIIGERALGLPPEPKSAPRADPRLEPRANTAAEGTPS